MGAFAVVTTLIFLIKQLRQNTASVDAAAEEAVASGFNTVNLTVANSTELGRLYLLGMASPESLSDSDAIRFDFLFRAYMNQYDQLLQLHKAGVLRTDRWQKYAGELALALESPGGALWMKRNPHFGYFRDAIKGIERFRSWIGPLVAEVPDEAARPLGRNALHPDALQEQPTTKG